MEGMQSPGFPLPRPLLLWALYPPFSQLAWLALLPGGSMDPWARSPTRADGAGRPGSGAGGWGLSGACEKPPGPPQGQGERRAPEGEGPWGGVTQGLGQL